MAAAPPEIDGYTLGRCLGRGAHGTVWSATDLRSGLPVAIKVPRPRDAEGAMRFAREVRFLKQLRHPGVVHVLDAGWTQVGGRLVPYAVLPLHPGGTLADHLGTLSWATQQSLLTDLLAALAHVHAHGVVHRDLKPSNILVSPGPRRPCLADFGIAMSSSDDADGAGTAAYASPEQLLGHPSTPRSDLYSLGCVAFALASGAPPFTDSSRVALTQAHTRRPPPRMAARIAVPTGLEAWVARLLEKDPRRRFPSAAHAKASLTCLGPAVLAPSQPSAIQYEPGVTVTSSPARPSAPPTPHPVDVEAASAQGPALLVGRQEPVEAILQTVRRLPSAKSLQVLQVEGERGSGRRSVVRAAGVAIAQYGLASALPSSTDPTLAARLLRRHLGVDPRTTARPRAWRAALPEGCALTDAELVILDGGSDPAATASALHSALSAIASEGPLVLVVDEVGEDEAPWWASGPTSGPVLVLTATSTGSEGPTVQLGPLQRTEIRRILEEAGTPPGRIPAAVEASGGLPGRALASLRNDAASHPTLPELASDAHAVCERLALLPNGTPAVVLARACSDVGDAAIASAEAALAEANIARVVAGVWRVDDAAALRAIAAGARAQGRSALHHASVARALPASPAWRVASHWLEAQRPEQGAHVLTSGEPGWSLEAFEVVSACASALATHRSDHPALAELLRQLAHFATTYGDPAAARALIDEAEVRAAHDPRILGRVAVWRSLAAFREGDTHASAAFAATAWDCGAAGGDPLLQVRAAIREGIARSHHEGTDALDAALARARGLGVDPLPPELESFMSVLEGGSAQAKRDLDSAERVFQRGIAIADAAGRPDLAGQLHHYMLDLRLDQGDPSAARECLDQIRTGIGVQALNSDHIALRLAYLALLDEDSVGAREAVRGIPGSDMGKRATVLAALAAADTLDEDYEGASRQLDELEATLASHPARGLHTLRCLTAVTGAEDIERRALEMGRAIAQAQGLSAWMERLQPRSGQPRVPHARSDGPAAG